MKIRPYSKSELAQAYAPEITSQAALNRLAAWIRLNRPLTAFLHGSVATDRLLHETTALHLPAGGTDFRISGRTIG